MEDNNDMPSASALETQSIGETGGEVPTIFRDSSNIAQGVPPKAKYKTKNPFFFSQSDTHSRAVWLMYLVISVASGSGNVQMVNKVIVTKGKFKDYMDEIQQCHELGVTPYRQHKNQYGIYVTPIRVYDEGICIGQCCHDGC